MSRVRGWTIAVLVTSGLEVLGLVTLLVQTQRLGTLFEAFLIDPYADGDALDAAAGSVSSLDLLIVAVSIASLVAVIGWLHACVKAVGDLGLGALRHSSGWAIGAWFVPVLNLVRVPQIVADVHRAGRRRIAPVGLVVGVWWALWLGSVLVDRIAATYPVPDTVSEVRQALTLTSVAAIGDILSALATLGLVLLLSGGLRDAAAAPPTLGWPTPQPHLAAYAGPATAFGTPAPQFGTPTAQTIAAPSPQFGTPPAQPYAAPEPRFGTAPAQPYAAPAPPALPVSPPTPQPYGAPEPHARQYGAPGPTAAPHAQPVPTYPPPTSAPPSFAPPVGAPVPASQAAPIAPLPAAPAPVAPAPASYAAPAPPPAPTTSAAPPRARHAAPTPAAPAPVVPLEVPTGSTPQPEAPQQPSGLDVTRRTYLPE